MEKRFPLEDQIEALGWSLRGRIVPAGYAEFDGLRTVQNGRFDARPAAIVRVANAADVAAVLNFAQATDLRVAVRSGGHSIAGHSGIEGGLVIDLRDLKSLDIDHDAMTVWAGTGLAAGEVTAALEPHGLVVGFGDSATVGIGGLTLGGGVGYLVRKHGLTIDSLVAAEIVTATGDIVIADETQHADLFWALRGGGGNFGVVTRFKYRMHALPAFTGGALILPATAEVLAGFVAAADAAPEELSVIALVMPMPPLPFLPAALHGKTVLMGTIGFAGDPEAAQRALAPFRALATPIADLIRPAPYSSMYIPEDPRLRPAISVRSRFTDSFGIAEAAEMLARLESCDAPMKIAQVRVLGGAMARVPEGATAFAHRGSRYMLAMMAFYGPPALAADYDRWAGDAMAAVCSPDAPAYVNFLGSEGSAGIAAAYPATTLERLREVKGRYDPQNLFRLNQNILPA